MASNKTPFRKQTLSFLYDLAMVQMAYCGTSLVRKTVTAWGNEFLQLYGLPNPGRFMAFVGIEESRLYAFPLNSVLRSSGCIYVLGLYIALAISICTARA